ncbi:MAG: hypothetical protein GJT30_00710 [Geobacter sp.]|nr:hypothetical protein [Geobacter sp.]
MSKELILPSEIPWDDIKGSELEELLYWLFESMGAKDLEWRKGGKGPGTADQGRDIECTFYTSSPEGELTKQKWWVEAKGRSSTVDPSSIKESILNVAGSNDIDVLVIATNAQFSNPTRDWVKEWQKTHKSPVIKLWERSCLERMVSKHPLAVIRLFTKALSAQGKLEVARTKLWNYATFTDRPHLAELWRVKSELVFEQGALFALIASEMANGDITKRSWAAYTTNEVLLLCVLYSLTNSFYLFFRISEAGARQEPVIKAFSYLLLVAVHRAGAKTVLTLINNIFDDFHGKKLPSELRKFILEPVINTLTGEIRDVCTHDCSRISTDPSILTKPEIKDYWKRLRLAGDEEEKDDRILTIECFSNPCRFGIATGDKKHCPICFLENPEMKLSKTLKTVETLTKAHMSSA